jgi:hypothetical protein
VPPPKSDCQCHGGNGSEGEKTDPQVESIVRMITEQILKQLGTK